MIARCAVCAGLVSLIPAFCVWALVGPMLAKLIDPFGFRESALLFVCVWLLGFIGVVVAMIRIAVKEGEWR